MRSSKKVLGDVDKGGTQSSILVHSSYQEKFHKTKKTHPWFNSPTLGFQCCEQAGSRQLAQVQWSLKARCLCRRGEKHMKCIQEKCIQLRKEKPIWRI